MCKRNRKRNVGCGLNSHSTTPMLSKTRHGDHGEKMDGNYRSYSSSMIVGPRVGSLSS